MKKVMVVTGASSGFGALAHGHSLKARHVVYARMRDTSGHNRGQVQEAAKFAANNKARLRTARDQPQSRFMALTNLNLCHAVYVHCRHEGTMAVSHSRTIRTRRI
jgi:NAD(P)-dependent dehydrogenase (short-subunit alcohol dehydrogenase family)